MEGEAPEQPQQQKPEPKLGPQEVVTKDGLELIIEKDKPVQPVTYDKTGKPVSPTSFRGETADVEAGKSVIPEEKKIIDKET